MTALEIIKGAKAASSALAIASTETKNEVLKRVSQGLERHQAEILEANQKDIDQNQQLPSGLVDRLTLTTERISGLRVALAELIKIADPVGELVQDIHRPNGLNLKQVRVPFGLIGAIYEARPNVTVDIAAMAIKTGNAIVLRGGSAAENTNRVLVKIFKEALAELSLPVDAVSSVDEFGRDGANAMMQARGLVDVLIPRGSAELIRTVVIESKVPVIETGDGLVHVFIDATAREDYAVEIVRNSKVQRPSVCNALETVLIHKDAVDRLLLPVLTALDEAQVVIHGDVEVLKRFPKAVPATEEDWSTEYLSLDVSVKVVDSFADALDHIKKYSSSHTESIITEDAANAERFLQEVDSAVVMVNASTRFTDGFEFGFGAEVGISTQKLHARGPMGLKELTSTKWLVRGSGQSRA
ncbi:MAG: glutamate-5-semialdehyde dehydrogenase [Microbacteriaceae bacterium]|nr:glutamate-5-semialdehyde dehydrogenase [Microbacteriaceae bacterium]